MRQHLLIVLLFGVLPQLAAAGQLIDQHDRFTQKRELKWMSDVRSADPQAMGLNASVYFVNGDRPFQVLAHLAGGFEQIEYANCNQVYWLASGEPVTPIEQQYKILPRKVQGTYLEVFTSVFSVEDFQRLASAASVEYKVCNTVGAVPVEDLEGLRQIQALMKTP